MIDMYNHKVLIGITTYGSYAYIDLGISSLKRYTNDIIVLDDGSYSKKLQKVCDKHKVLCIGRLNQRQEGIGFADVKNTFNLIRIGKELGYQLVLKVSRRCILLEDPRQSLLKLKYESNGIIFSNQEKHYNFPIRTQCFAFDVNKMMPYISNLQNSIIQQEQMDIQKSHLSFESDNRNNQNTWVQVLMHKMAKDIQPIGLDKKYTEYINNHSNSNKGYIKWDWIGDDRFNPPPYILWHDKHNQQDYLECSKSFELNYTLDDFKSLS